MRDTSLLRRRLAALACLPALSLASTACTDPPRPSKAEGKPSRSGNDDEPRSVSLATPQPRRKLEVSDRRVAYYEAKAEREGKTLQEVMPPAQYEAHKRRTARDERKLAAHRDSIKAATEEPTPAPIKVDPRLQPIAGDPPYIDGYNPEEDTCESGNWCGPLDAVQVIEVPKVEGALGCPGKIAGGKGSEQIKSDAKTYDGLSSAPNMQGAFNEHGTELARARTGNDQICCYHWFEYCSGRPLLDDGHARTAVLVPNPSPAPDAPPPLGVQLPAAVRETIAAQWADDALAEHASVAAFARATLELLAVGAPARLLAGSQRAGVDEVDHTERCLALHRAYGAPKSRPGPLPAVSVRAATLAQLATDTFAEGCVGETIAALCAERAATGCTVEPVAEHLRVIADDEGRHAALAWSTIGWAIDQGGAEVRDALAAAAAALRADVSATEPPPHPHAALLAAHGRLDDAARHRATRDAWAQIIDPMLAALLDHRAPAAEPAIAPTPSV